MQWHWVDLTIMAIIALSVLTGLFRGFVKELIALCAWLLAFWLAFNYAPLLYPWLADYLHDHTVKAISAFLLVLFATILVGGIVNALLSFILKRSGLNGTDRILGMGFGFVRGVFLVALAMVTLKITAVPHEQYVQTSRLYSHFEPIVSWLYASMPGFIKQVKLMDNQDEPLPQQLASSPDDLLFMPTTHRANK